MASLAEARSLILEIAEIDERKRLHFPAHLTEGIDWMSGTQPKATMRLDRPGRISLLSSSEHGSRILTKREELFRSLPDEDVEAALLVLEDRYREVAGERGRITLPILALVHLFGGKDFDKYVFLVRVVLRLEIWSTAYRNERLLRGSHLLDDLP
jgi:hypothetical protein